MTLGRFYFIVPIRVFKCLIHNGGSENGKDHINLKDIWKTFGRTCLLNGYKRKIEKSQKMTGKFESG